MLLFNTEDTSKPSQNLKAMLSVAVTDENEQKMNKFADFHISLQYKSTVSCLPESDWCCQCDITVIQAVDDP